MLQHSGLVAMPETAVLTRRSSVREHPAPPQCTAVIAVRFLAASLQSHRLPSEKRSHSRPLRVSSDYVTPAGPPLHAVPSRRYRPRMPKTESDAPAGACPSLRPVLIAGPTASGKSALALGLARRLGGAVINADSQQVYGEWRVLTARPSAAEEAAVPHRLYGHVGLADAYSVGRWLDELSPALDEANTAGVRPIIVGGTGLYFKALTEGLAPIPEVPAGLRAEGEAELERLGLADFAARLAARDPETGAALDLDNPRRVLRAWEVLEGTGTGLAGWRARTPPPLVPLEASTAIVLDPPRSWLYARCEARLDAMLAAGALDEVRAVLSLGLEPGAPGLKAIGAAELAAHLAGAITLAEATAYAKIETRRYAKRQLTWMRNQMTRWTAFDPTAPELAARALALVTG